MLTKLKKNELDKYIDYAYDLALDVTRSSYPTYADGVKTKQDFIKISEESFLDTNREILLFSVDGNILGWINYYIIPEDKYIGLDAFVTEKHTQLALKEFEIYCKKNYKGFTLYFGFSSENSEAISYFKENGYNLLESSYPNVFHLKNYKPLKSNDKIIKIAKANFYLFEHLHKPVDSDMYWNTERIFNDLEHWQIYYYNNSNGQGAIYFRGNELKEIFGIDYSDGEYNPSICRELLIACINKCVDLNAQHLYYFSENDEGEILSKLGFDCLGEYKCYTLCLT